MSVKIWNTMHVVIFSRFSSEEGRDIHKLIIANLKSAVLKDSLRHSFKGDFHKYEFFLDYIEDKEVFDQLKFLTFYKHIVRIVLTPCKSFNFDGRGVIYDE